MSDQLPVKVLLQTKRSILYVVEKWCQDYTEELLKLELDHYPPISLGLQRRDVRFFSDEAKSYRYSNTEAKAWPMNETLRHLTQEVNKALKTKFNGVLVNRYADGKDYLSAHSDSEKGLDPKRRTVAGVSFGAQRTFRIRERESNKIVFDYEWPRCALLVMEGDFQLEFKHEIPKRLKVEEPRVSITWRIHKE